MKYHQTKREKHNDRISDLKKVDDKYNYDDVIFQASYDDIKQFENNNQVSFFVYTISTENEIMREYIGNPEYISNDNINLLRIEHDDISHYIYIKHILRWINLSAQKIIYGCWCPYCEKQ